MFNCNAGTINNHNPLGVDPHGEEPLGINDPPRGNRPGNPHSVHPADNPPRDDLVLPVRRDPPAEQNPQLAEEINQRPSQNRQNRLIEMCSRLKRTLLIAFILLLLMAGAIGGTVWIPIKENRIDSITVQSLPNGKDSYAVEIESAINYPIENAVELRTNLDDASIAVSTHLNTTTKHESAKLDLSTSLGPGFNSFYCHKDFTYAACVVGVLGSNFTYDIQHTDIHGNKHTVCKGNWIVEHSNCTMLPCPPSSNQAGFYNMSASGKGSIEYNMSYVIIDVDSLSIKCTITSNKKTCQLTDHNKHRKTIIVLQPTNASGGEILIFFKKTVWFLALATVLGYIIIILPVTIMLMLLIKYAINTCRNRRMHYPIANENVPLILFNNNN